MVRASRWLTSAADERRVSHATRLDIHTSDTTRAMDNCTSSGVPWAMARAMIRSIWKPTSSTSLATDASANMNARVMASVRLGWLCMALVIISTTTFIRSCAVSPGGALRSVRWSRRRNSRASAETSRCTLEGK